MSESPIRAGDKLKCVEDHRGYLTLGKCYEVVRICCDPPCQNPHVIVVDDDGTERSWSASRFTRLPPEPSSNPLQVASGAVESEGVKPQYDEEPEYTEAELFVKQLEEMGKPYNRTVQQLENAARSDRCLVEALKEKHAGVWGKGYITSRNVLLIIDGLESRLKQAEQEREQNDIEHNKLYEQQRESLRAARDANKNLGEQIAGMLEESAVKARLKESGYKVIHNVWESHKRQFSAIEADRDSLRSQLKERDAQLAAANVKLLILAQFEAWIKKQHNGYSEEARKFMPTLQRARELNRSSGRTARRKDGRH